LENGILTLTFKLQKQEEIKTKYQLSPIVLFGIDIQGEPKKLPLIF